MGGLESFMWRAPLPWRETIAIAGAVVARWNTVTAFVTHTDERERIWTARHSSVAQPFLVISQDAPHGSAPRIGNPLAMLLLLGMAHERPGCVELSFANGQKIDALKFDPADLTSLLPQATHPAHRKLAALAVLPRSAA